MKKYTSIYYLIILVFVVGITSCKKDDPIPNGPPPTGDGILSSIAAQLGENIVFTGTVTDEIGLKSISITYTDWALDKTIELSNNLLTYDLNYTFLIPNEATPGSHTAIITILNTSEKTTEVNVIVTVANPVPTGTVASPIEVAPEGDITFTGSFADKIGLSNVNIVYAPWSLNETIIIADSPTNYSLSHPFSIPAEAAIGEHNVVVSVMNSSGETTAFNVTVTITDAPTSYDAVWVAGSFQWWEWNAEGGYMMLQDPNDEQW